MMNPTSTCRSAGAARQPGWLHHKLAETSAATGGVLWCRPPACGCRHSCLATLGYGYGIPLGFSRWRFAQAALPGIRPDPTKMKNNPSVPPHRDGLQRQRCGDATPGNAGRGGGREPRQTPEGSPQGTSGGEYQSWRLAGGRAEKVYGGNREPRLRRLSDLIGPIRKRPTRPGSQSRATGCSSRPSTFSDQIRPLMIEPRRNDRRRLARTLALRRAFEKSAISGLIGVELKWYRDPASQTRATASCFPAPGFADIPKFHQFDRIRVNRPCSPNSLPC